MLDRLLLALAVLAAGLMIYFAPALTLYRALDSTSWTTGRYVIPDGCELLNDGDHMLCVLLATIDSRDRTLTRLERDNAELTEELDVRRQAYTVSVAAEEFQDGTLTDAGVQAAIGACEVTLPPQEIALSKPIRITGHPGHLSGFALRSETPVEAMIYIDSPRAAQNRADGLHFDATSP